MEDWRTAIQREGKARTREVRKARRDFQRTIQADRQQREQASGAKIEELLESVRVKEDWDYLAWWHCQVGNPVSHIILNILVDAVVRAVLNLVFSPQEEQHGMVWSAGDINIMLYLDGSRISWRDHEWVQDALMLMVAMFHRMGLGANLENTKAMVCTPGFV